MPLGAPLIAAGASLLSGLFGRSSAKKQAAKEEEAIRKANDVATANASQMNREIRARADAAALVPVQTSHQINTLTQGGVNMAGFMAAAEANGFNPLTFLRSGALSLFANSLSETEEFTCTTGERAMDAALSGTYLPQLAPVLSSTKVPGVGEIFGNALTAGTNQYLSDQADDRNFRQSLMLAQLRGAQSPGAYGGSRFGFVPSYTTSGVDGQALPSGGSDPYGGDGGAFSTLYIPYINNANPVPLPNGSYANQLIWGPRTLSLDSMGGIGLLLANQGAGNIIRRAGNVFGSGSAPTSESQYARPSYSNTYMPDASFWGQQLPGPQ